MKTTFSLLFILLFFGEIQAQVFPTKEYPQLFNDVQAAHIFPDQKTFADCNPKINPDSLDLVYLQQKTAAGFSLKAFVDKYFKLPENDTTIMLSHLHYLWDDLTRQPHQSAKYSTLLQLPDPYIIPGGRFKEIYYWDSYFTMLGLQVDGRIDIIRNMVDNFAYLIETYGHIPNGNRSYYLSRSQIPFFSMMVELLADASKNKQILVQYLPAMKKEYEYWMSGNKVVKLEDGTILNRYWDELNTPRPEAYIHDVNLYNQGTSNKNLYRDLRSSAESGIDFSSRWFSDGENLKTIVTTQILPVDLNCMLYKLEEMLAKACELKNETKAATEYDNAAKKRKVAILKYFWNPEVGYFTDYYFLKGEYSPQLTLAGMFPLFMKLAEKDQAEKVAVTMKSEFLKPGGFVTSLVHTGQQWDAPNGWAPLQWISYAGLKNYGFNPLANEQAQRWVKLNAKVYFETGKMKEKYDVEDPSRPGGGGEYEGQDGFGWTNGVFLRMWQELHPGFGKQ